MQEHLFLSRTHSLFGYLGLIPFFGLVVASERLGGHYAEWLLSYAALIFTFLGGIIWFSSLVEGAAKHQVWVSIIGMLWAWSWLIYPLEYPMLIAGISFLALWLYERHCLVSIYPAEFWTLRTVLSLGAASALIAAEYLV